jgi:hypothetical protein
MEKNSSPGDRSRKHFYNYNFSSEVDFFTDILIYLYNFATGNEIDHIVYIYKLGMKFNTREFNYLPGYKTS